MNSLIDASHFHLGRTACISNYTCLLGYMKYNTEKSLLYVDLNLPEYLVFRT